MLGELSELSKPEEEEKKKTSKKKKKKKKNKKVHQDGSVASLPSDGLSLESLGEALEEGAKCSPRTVVVGKQDEEEEDDDDCSLCLETLGPSSSGGGVSSAVTNIEALVCGHRFHVSCVEVLVNHYCKKAIEASCPMCRRPLARKG